MSIFLRGLLIGVSFFTFWYVVRKIRKSQMQIEDTVFWVVFVFAIFMMGAFPGLVFFFAHIIDIDAPVNFVFLSIIFILLLKTFFQSVKISQMENRLTTLVQKIALSEMQILEDVTPETKEGENDK